MSMAMASGFVRVGAVAILAACGLAASPAMGQVRPPEEGYQKAPNADFGPGLGFFDARLDAEGVALKKVTDRVDALRKTAAWAVGGAREADQEVRCSTRPTSA